MNRIPIGHILSFRVPDLPAGYADCVGCGQRITAQGWATFRCPGRPVAEEPAGRVQ